MSEDENRNEAETRSFYIDPALKRAGWGVVEGTRIREEFPISKGRLIGNNKRASPDWADYVLQYRNVNLAVIEAKEEGSDYTKGVGQAKDYAERLHVRYTYSSNGKKIYAMDMDKGTEGDINAYPTPDELWAMTFETENTLRDCLIKTPFEDKSGSWEPRYYQDIAIKKSLEAISNNKSRLLLTLATGTGKTAIAFQIAWSLFHNNWNLQKDGKRKPRILFLTDRNFLANEAYNSFSPFDNGERERITPKKVHKAGKVPTNANIFFTIFRSFMSADEKGFFFGQYEKDFFDLIFIDECHRGGANDESTWRGILEYFSPAVQLGLTATPRRDDNIDTYDYFGKPIYTYSLKQGIEDGFLSPYRVTQITSPHDEYNYSDGDLIVEGEIDKDKTYSESEINKSIEIEDRERDRVKQFMDLINQGEKTIVFCHRQKHALLIRNLINQYAKSTNPNYCHRVTADDGELGEEKLRQFQDNEKTIPTILTTSSKLSTGLDVRELRNIVLMRPVNSMIEFKQIVGRGTRTFDKKDFFTIYDFVKAHEHFKDPEWDGEPEGSERFNDPKSVCASCLERPCVCKKPDIKRCEKCGSKPCACEAKPRQLIKVKLSDGSIRNMRSDIVRTFWGPDGKQISLEEYVLILFDDLPNLVSNESELREVWSIPETRKKLLKELAEIGHNVNQLKELQILIDAQKCDLFDVISFIAFNRPLIRREVRANNATLYLDNYDAKQQAFLDFVLTKYIEDGESELDEKKLPQLLELKYFKASDGIKELGGDARSIRENFIDLQKYLYESLVS